MNKNEGTFMWAIEQIEEGKKIRRPHWTSEEYHKMYRTDIYTENNKYAEMSVDDYKATDWEIYEEPKKTLYDKRCRSSGNLVFKVEYVKQAITEYLDVVQKGFNVEYKKKSNFYKIAKEIFGSELVD